MIDGLHRAAHPGVGDEGAGVAQHGELRRLPMDLDVRGDRAEAAGSTWSPIASTTPWRSAAEASTIRKNPGPGVVGGAQETSRTGRSPLGGAHSAWKERSVSAGPTNSQSVKVSPANWKARGMVTSRRRGEPALQESADVPDALAAQVAADAQHLPQEARAERGDLRVCVHRPVLVAHGSATSRPPARPSGAPGSSPPGERSVVQDEVRPGRLVELRDHRRRLVQQQAPGPGELPAVHLRRPSPVLLPGGGDRLEPGAGLEDPGGEHSAGPSRSRVPAPHQLRHDAEGRVDVAGSRSPYTWIVAMQRGYAGRLPRQLLPLRAG